MSRWSDEEVEQMPDLHGADSLSRPGWLHLGNDYHAEHPDRPVDDWEEEQEVGNEIPASATHICMLCGEPIRPSGRKCVGCGSIHSRRVRT